jgi:hypothetical protein
MTQTQDIDEWINSCDLSRDDGDVYDLYNAATSASQFGRFKAFSKGETIFIYTSDTKLLRLRGSRSRSKFLRLVSRRNPYPDLSIVGSEYYSKAMSRSD